MDSKRFWDKSADKYAKSKMDDPAAYEQTLDRIKALLRDDMRVLELGCGTGSTALDLANGVGSYLATDISPRMIEIARAKQNETTPDHLTFEVQTDGAMPGGPFDAILALNLLHLLPNLEHVLADIYNALPSDGLFIAKTGLLRDGAWFLPLIVPVMRAVGKAPYVRALRDAELRGLIQNAGFKLEETLLQDGLAPRLFTVARKP